MSSGIIERDLIAPVFSLNVFKQCCTVLVVPLLYPVSIHFERAAVDKFTEVFDTIRISFYSFYRYRRWIVIEKLQSMEKSHTNNKGLEKIDIRKLKLNPINNTDIYKQFKKDYLHINVTFWKIWLIYATKYIYIYLLISNYKLTLNVLLG